MHIHRAPTCYSGISFDAFQWMCSAHCAEATIRKWFFDAIENKNRKYCWNIQLNVSTVCIHSRWWIDRIAWWFGTFSDSAQKCILVYHYYTHVMLNVDGCTCVCVCWRCHAYCIVQRLCFVYSLFGVNALRFVYQRATVRYTEAHERVQFFKPTPMQTDSNGFISFACIYRKLPKHFLLRAVSFSVARIARM